MNLNYSYGRGGKGSVGRRLEKAGAAAGPRLRRQISTAKATIFAESSPALTAQVHLLRLALNEAEAVAGQTLYPELVFPVLATEKVQAVIAWVARQQTVRQTSAVFALAA